MKLTKQQIDACIATNGDCYVWDGLIKGFGVRVRPSGAKTFIYSYRANGGRGSRKVRHTIGRYGAITLDQARKNAQQLAGLVAGGGDPAAERAAKRQADARIKLTVTSIGEDFIEKHAKPNNRSWREYERILKHSIEPRIGKLAIHELRRRDIVNLLDHVADGSGAVMADHVLAVLRKMLNWHAVRDDEFRSPIVVGMSRTRPRDMARDRVLTDDEIRRIWAALHRFEYPFGPLVRLLLSDGATKAGGSRCEMGRTRR